MGSDANGDTEQAIRCERINGMVLASLKAATSILKKVDAIEVHRRGDVVYCPYCQAIEQADAAIAAMEEETGD